MGLATIWKNLDFDRVFTYKTSRIAVVQDRRLGLLKLLFVAGILTYVIIVVIVDQGFLARETPRGSVRMSVRAPESRADPTTLRHCTGQAAPLTPSIPCRTVDEGDPSFFASLEGSILVPTRVNISAEVLTDPCTRRGGLRAASSLPENDAPSSSRAADPRSAQEPLGPLPVFARVVGEVAREARAGATGSLALGEGPPGPSSMRSRGSLSMTQAAGAPGCGGTFAPTSQSAFYPTDVEDFTFKIDIAAAAPTLGVSTSNGELTGQIRRCDGTTSETSSVVFTMREILSWACVDDLDAESDAAEGESIRYAGGVLIVEAKFSNVGTINRRLALTYSAQLIPKTEYKFSRTISSADLAERSIVSVHGILVAVEIKGQLGVFSFPTLVVQLTASLGLLAVATILVDFLMLLLPEKEEYRSLKFEVSDDFSTLRDRKRHGGVGAAAPVEMAPAHPSDRGTGPSPTTAAATTAANAAAATPSSNDVVSAAAAPASGSRVTAGEGNGPKGNGPKGNGPKGNGPKGNGPKGNGPTGKERGVPLSSIQLQNLREDSSASSSSSSSSKSSESSTSASS